MDLDNLGFDSWFEQRAGDISQPGRSFARITAVDRDAFLLRTKDAEICAELAGKLRFSIKDPVDLPCVGDWVSVQGQASGGPAIIHSILPRRSFLRRKRPGEAGEVQMIAANIDVAFVMQACQYDFNIPRIERYLVMAREGHVEPRIILSKTDLLSPEELAQVIVKIKNAGISAQILPLSNISGSGLEEFKSLLVPGRTYCLLGSSGVGKTTLINRLIGHDAYDTKPVSETGEGVHTTSRRHLLVLDHGAMLIDTPGMRELGLIAVSEGMDESFVDVGDMSQSCRFSNCTHISEPGCAVLKAVETGALSKIRYDNYIKLKKETEFHDLTYAEKRKRDKSFGKFIKTAKKSLKK